MKKGLSKKSFNILLVLVFIYILLFSLLKTGVINYYYSGIINLILINVILAVSLNLIVGFTGQLCLGHAGLTAIGAFFIVYTPYQMIDGQAFLTPVR